jgi:hypothetical protein
MLGNLFLLFLKLPCPKIADTKKSVTSMNKGQFTVRRRPQKNYTLAFKMQVVEEVESGELSQDAAQRKYVCQAMLLF